MPGPTPASPRSVRGVATAAISLVLSGIWAWATTTGRSWVTAAMNCGIDPSARRAPREHLPCIANAVNLRASFPPASATAGCPAPASVSACRCARVQATHAVTSASGSSSVRTRRMVASHGGWTVPSNGCAHPPRRSSCDRERSAAHCAAASSDSNPGTVNADKVTASTYPNG